VLTFLTAPASEEAHVAYSQLCSVAEKKRQFKTHTERASLRITGRVGAICSNRKAEVRPKTKIRTTNSNYKNFKSVNYYILN